MNNPQKTYGFLKIKRKDPDYRPIGERIKDFSPVEIPLTEDEIVMQATRCMDCGTPFCHSCGCPLANLIPEINNLVYKKKWNEALQLLLATSNFPEFTARICPALCEASCTLSINNHPVSFRQIELAIIETAFEKGLLKPRIPTNRKTAKIAVIGSGPAGLAVADTLNQHGYNVTVFEKSPKPGGILRYGIPDFKLEKKVLDRRISLMKAEGIIFETNTCIGKDLSFNYLKNKFQAICLAGGSEKPRDLQIPGRELKGVHFAMEYLIQQNKKIAGEKIESEEINAHNKNVLIIGGGDTASDCLGTAIRQGAKNITMIEILPKPPLSRSETNPWPQWPIIYRENSSHKEGGTRLWQTTCKKFIGSNGLLSSAECVEVEWFKTENGSNSFREKNSAPFTIQCDLALIALGFIGPQPNPLIQEIGIKTDPKGIIIKNEKHMTNIDGVFAAGDTATGQSLVVRAINDGRQTAFHIIEYLENLPSTN